MLINIPTSCPSCGSELESSGLELFCVNTDMCPAQSSKRIENFTKVMKIKGLGAKSIEKLMDHEYITTIPDLYTITQSQLTEVLGQAIGNKVYNEIQNSKTQTFQNFIQAIGIKTISTSSAKIIASECKSIENFNLATLDNPVFIKKLGQVKFSNLKDFLLSDFSKSILSLPLDLQSQESNTVSPTETKGVVCITGKLNDFPNRKAAQDYLESLGWIVKSSVTKDVTHLVCEDPTKESSSSYKKALDKGIPILAINELP